MLEQPVPEGPHGKHEELQLVGRADLGEVHGGLFLVGEPSP